MSVFSGGGNKSNSTMEFWNSFLMRFYNQHNTKKKNIIWEKFSKKIYLSFEETSTFDDIKWRIALASIAFGKMKEKIWGRKNIL